MKWTGYLTFYDSKYHKSSFPFQRRQDSIFQCRILGALWFNLQLTFQPQLSSLPHTPATPLSRLQFPQSFALIHPVPWYKQYLLPGLPNSTLLAFHDPSSFEHGLLCSLSPGYWLPMTTQEIGLSVHSRQQTQRPRDEGEKIKVWS